MAWAEPDDSQKVAERRGLTGSSSPVTLAKAAEAQLPFSADDVKDKDSPTFVAVEHAAGEPDDLAIARAAKLPRHRPAFGLIGELFYVCEDPLDKATGCFRLVESDIVGDGIKVAQGRFGPNYFSHRDIRVLASACESVRPSSMARSPRVTPWSTASRRWSSSYVFTSTK